MGLRPLPPSFICAAAQVDLWLAAFGFGILRRPTDYIPVVGRVTFLCVSKEK